MDLHEIITKMKCAMAQDFEDRAVVFVEYKEFLEQLIASDFENVEACCLLAMVLCELREDTCHSLNVLEACYEKNKNTFSDDGFTLWATNISYFLLEECYEDKDQEAVELLQKAILRHSKFLETYYALGKYYFSNKDFKQAAEMFHITYSISQKRMYLYCEAICLLADSKIDDGIEMLESLYVYPFIDEELDAKIALSLGRELALKGNTKRASEIANNLLNGNYHEFDIEIDEMADYLYILKDYKACVELYDKCKFLEEADWIKKYFYALKQLGKLEDASKKLHCITEDIKQEIFETQENPSDFESEEELKMYLLSENKRLDEIVKCYIEVFDDNVEPKSSTYYDIYYSCYYINCPRHYVG